MQEIKCPWCGPRAQTEFEYFCDESALEPGWGNETGQQNLDRIFLRENHIGFHQEVWQHVLGCRGWFSLERHNATHEIAGSRALGAHGPPVVDEQGES